MTPEQSLARGATYLDEATENLTFDQYEWAFEEAWHGVGWLLNALAPHPVADISLGPAGEFPAAGTLRALLDRVGDPPSTSRIVTQMEALRAKIEDAVDREIALAVHAERIERVVFAAWDLHDSCGRRLALPDDRLGSKLLLVDPSPGRIGSQLLNRRTALKLLAAGTVLPLQACQKVERDNRPAAVASASRATPPPAEGVPQFAKPRAVTPMRNMHWDTTDPFLFCAHHLDEYPEGNEQLGPAASLDGRQLGRDFEGKDNWRMYHGRTIPGFPRHPHRGFETVTVVRTGLLDHSDSMGATARYGGGDVQWLTAGGGIQHAEMFPLLQSDSPNPLELFQIWLNLPASDKMVEPYFTMLWNEKIPRVVHEDASGKLIELTLAAGAYGEHKPPAPPPNSWASRADTDVAIWSIRMEPGSAFDLPQVKTGTKRSLYVHRGAGLQVGGQTIPHYHRVEVDDSGALQLRAGADEVEILLLQGRPIGEPVAKRGPFVMNTQHEIRQAYEDYQATQFGGWPWLGSDPVHERDKGRFAIHIDGRLDEPT